PQGEKIKSSWAENINPDQVWQEYPRPIMERKEWLNLNGLWQYAILPAGQAKPNEFDGNILVPFAVESSLSGVQKRVGKDHELWYSRSFSLPQSWKNKKVLLHFGGVDWKTDVWINDVLIGNHEGGYDPFWFNISPYLKSGEQELVVRVWDPSDKGPQPRGKQVKDPRGIWYTPVTGIWQTVWLEPVPDEHIAHLKITPDIDHNKVKVEVEAKANQAEMVEVQVLENGKVVGQARSALHMPVEVILPEPKLWSPETPFLYDLNIRLISDNKALDQVKSYMAMRKISRQRDERGIIRLQLNNQDLFHFGPLDQGWWPDGLYTAPSDEALVYDIQKTKDLGFNMIRKHVKVEPARWYYHCDRLGMLVWQDMPSGDFTRGWQNRNYFEGNELERSPVSEAIFRKEWKAIMDFLYSYPSIVVWVPFNEGWGQFKTEEIIDWTMQYDPSRLINPASGGNHFQVGDMLDLHNYPHPEMYLFDGTRANVLGEYGGIGLALKGHLWDESRNWGYVQFKTTDEVTKKYLDYAEELKKLIQAGFSAAVYTQTTDVEIEVNGLMTYDRKVIKMDQEAIRKVNQEICESLNQP
ncbi:MAG: glycoside hydrolase family 2 protein, partial [Candidatus Cyclobacteriaceae bacterium M3_2C_046]